MRFDFSVFLGNRLAKSWWFKDIQAMQHIMAVLMSFVGLLRLMVFGDYIGDLVYLWSHIPLPVLYGGPVMDLVNAYSGGKI